MPFPGFHACRLKQPGNFESDSFRSVKQPSGVQIIIGRLKGESSTTAQSIRYPIEKFTEGEARRKCKDKNGILFEPASESAADRFEMKDFTHQKLTQSITDQLLAGKTIETLEEPPELPTVDFDGVTVSSAGSWKPSGGGVLTITEDDLREMVDNAKKHSDRIRPVVKLLHIDEKTHKQITGKFAAGRVENLRVVGKKLIADLKKVPAKIAQLIKAGAFGPMSIEFFSRRSPYVDGEGNKIRNLLTAVSIIGSEPPAAAVDDLHKYYASGEDGAELITALSGEQPELLVELNQRSDLMEVTEKELQDKIKLATDVALSEALPKIKEGMTAEFAKALGTDGDPLKAAEELQKENEANEKKFAELAEKEFDRKTQDIIDQAKRDTKLIPADEDGIKDVVRGWKLGAEADGHKLETVHERLTSYFEKKDKIPGLTFKETGKAEPKDDKVSDEKRNVVQLDVEAFAERNDVGIDAEGVEQEQEIRAYQRKVNCSYNEAFSEVLGTPLEEGPVDLLPMNRVFEVEPRRR